MRVNYTFHYAFLAPREILGGITIDELKEQDRLPGIEEFCAANPFLRGDALPVVLQLVDLVSETKREEKLIFELYPTSKNPQGEKKLIDKYNPLMLTRPTYGPIATLNPNLIQIVAAPGKPAKELISDLANFVKPEYEEEFAQEIKRVKLITFDELSVELDSKLENKVSSNYVSLVLSANRLPYSCKDIKDLVGRTEFEELGTLLRTQRVEFGLTRNEWITLYLCDKIYELSFGASLPQKQISRDELSEQLEESARDARGAIGNARGCDNPETDKITDLEEEYPFLDELE